MSKSISNEFGQDWKAYLNGRLNSRIIHFLDLTFKARKISSPTIEDLKAITMDDLETSWLSVPSCKEFLLFKQQIQ